MNNTLKVPANMFTVAPGVWGRKDVFVNFYIIRDEQDDKWVLVDCGLKWSAPKIKEMAAHIFGEGSVPKAIILTHGHFDHVGSVEKLAEEWDIPVFAHHLEIPYLTGESDYPPPDPTVGGGLMATMSFLFPKSPINIWRHIKVLPANGNIPVLSAWRYIETPGHSPGHISLFRESDRVLITGDAFVTTDQASVVSVFFQSKIMSGPPKYFTPDYKAARLSVDKLFNLNPKTAGCGHGRPMRGKELTEALADLKENFQEKAVPEQGRYVPNPAITNDHGIVSLPPTKFNKNEVAIKAFSVTAIITIALMWSKHKKVKKQIEYDNQIEVEYNY
jgi:glyoxylase-like metal-dependent hydrolase (beta-lactamase superfamily II)